MSDTNGNDDHDSVTGEIMAPTSMEAAISAEINQQVQTAHRFPRRLDKAISAEIMSRATLNDQIASECMYAKPQGSKQVTGPSARFAEIVFASFGNLRVAARFVRIDDDHPLRQAVVVEAVCLDLQSNNARMVPNRRSIMTSPKNGQPRPYPADLINTTMAAAASIATREAILKVVPKSVWIEAYERVVAVIQGDQKTLVERRAKAIAAFGGYGVKPADLFAALNVPDENGIGLDLMPTLIGMYTALKEGEGIEAVLGRAREESGAAPAKPSIRSPLADDPPRGDAPPPAEVSRSTVERPAAETSRQDQQRQDPEKIKEAIQTVAKEQQSGQARTEPAGASKAETAVKQRATPETAPATVQSAENDHPQDRAGERDELWIFSKIIQHRLYPPVGHHRVGVDVGYQLTR